ncbi:MAG: MBL fold metallo-hydrolase [Pseudomonadota bacterium]
MRVVCLGTGTPEPWAPRASSGYLVETGNETLLLDCGGGVFDNLLRSGRMPGDVDRLLFSHLHSDHMIDYPRLAHARWDTGEGAALKVHGPAPLAEITRRCFGPEGWLAHDLSARTELDGSKAVWLARGGALPRPWPAPEVQEIGPGDVVEGDGWRATTCEVPHAQPWLTCMALRIDAGGRSVVYSGDAGPSADLEAMSAGADLLIHWCYRFSEETVSDYIADRSPLPADIAAMATRAGVRRLALTHLRVHMDTPEKRAQALAEMRGAFEGDAVIAEDLMEFHL